MTRRPNLPEEVEPPTVPDSAVSAETERRDVASAMGELPTPPPASDSMTRDSILAACPRRSWNPDPEAMLLFNEKSSHRGKEEFRALRSHLSHIQDKTPLKSILIASALPREGRSFVAASLAQVFALQPESRVLLIDADLRNPRLHIALGTSATPGLSDYLLQGAEEFGIIQRGTADNLFLIPSGRAVTGPTELVGNGRLKSLLDRIDPLFDWIIIDSPAAVPASDARLLANYCDGVLLVVRSDSTPYDIVRRARQRFSEEALLGVVLNVIDVTTTPAFSSDDRSDSRNSPQDLNPLLDPLLERNLSQWTKVYFTTPPEGRDQAVRDLLRKLQLDVHSNAANPSEQPPAVVPAAKNGFCSNCQSQNPANQQFCGFCGAALKNGKPTERVEAEPEKAKPAQAAVHLETPSFLGLEPNEDKNLDFLREKSYGSEHHGTDVDSHRGRYAIAIVIIIVAGLIYVNWPFLRSYGQSNLRRVRSAQSPAVARSGSAQSNLPPTTSETQPSANDEAPPQIASSKNFQPATSRDEDKVPHQGSDAIGPSRTDKPLTFASSRKVVSAGPDGTQEMLQAQRYLDGRGVAHYSGQAAALLWKAVGKQNARADVLLADLYMRGDGVPRNCDQARLLLAAAAKKSAPGAAEKLRNLESGGCQ